MSLPNPPVTVAFSVTGSYLNVFQSGAFVGQMPLLAIPDLPFSPDGEICFVPNDDPMFS